MQYLRIKNDPTTLSRIEKSLSLSKEKIKLKSPSCRHVELSSYVVKTEGAFD
jgi:hypothetical protein